MGKSRGNSSLPTMSEDITGTTFNSEGSSTEKQLQV